MVDKYIVNDEGKSAKVEDARNLMQRAVESAFCSEKTLMEISSWADLLADHEKRLKDVVNFLFDNWEDCPRMLRTEIRDIASELNGIQYSISEQLQRMRGPTDG